MMSEAKHTPGPWTANSISMENGDIGVSAPDLRISIAHVHNAASFGDMLAGALKRGGGRFHDADCHTQFANARLIAAAPEQYAAALEIDRLSLLIESAVREITGPSSRRHEAVVLALKANRAAIAKTTGDTTKGCH